LRSAAEAAYFSGMETQSALSPAAAGTAKAPDLMFVTVAAITSLARDTNAYTFGRSDGAALPSYKAGAHIDVHLPNGLTRQFSLVRPAAADPSRYVVGIKRDPASRGGTSYIFDQLKVGDTLKISVPRNNFPLADSAAPVVLIAGGIGITPIWCMAQELAAQGRPWTLYYSCRSRADMAFLAELEPNDGGRVHLHFDDEANGQFLDLAAAIAAAPPDAHFYCCGPTPMLGAFQAIAAGRPAGHVHLEYFAPKDDAAGSGHIGGFWVELARSGEEYYIPEGKKILEVLYAAGVDVDYSCELGICGACETRVISGVPEHHDSVLSEEDQASNTKVMICCAGSKTERLVLDL
jgi:ferredoxin-NADP reductase